MIGKVTREKKRPDFIIFTDEIIAELPKERELHVILDNYCTHKKNEEWLQNHPNVFFHFTPTSASWLNQFEIWFGMFTGKSLRGADLKTQANSEMRLSHTSTTTINLPDHLSGRKVKLKGLNQEILSIAYAVNH